MEKIIENMIRFKNMCDKVSLEDCTDEKCSYKEICEIMTSSMPDSWNMDDILKLKEKINH